MKNQNFSGMALVVVSTLNSNSFQADKNGLMPVILTSISGTIPNRNVLSGTVADAAGLEAGNTYLVQCTEQSVDPTYGRRFNWLKLDQVKGLDIIKTKQELGAGSVFDVSDVVEEAVATTTATA